MRNIAPVLYAAAACAAAGCAVPAASSASEFSGSCVAAGIASFDAQLGIAPAIRAHVYEGSGTCTGTLDGQPVLLAPYEHRVQFPVGANSCTANAGVDGEGTIAIDPPQGPAREIRFLQSVPGLGSVEAVTLRGRDGGSALGTLLLPPSRELGDQCTAGEIQDAAQALVWSTVTPLSG
ncbi:MAG TPA: hypothetical protein VF520_11405 [Thermoleophilaceae bacterium]|jgi:hypothetical protein